MRLCEQLNNGNNWAEDAWRRWLLGLGFRDSGLGLGFRDVAFAYVQMVHIARGAQLSPQERSICRLGPEGHYTEGAELIDSVLDVVRCWACKKHS